MTRRKLPSEEDVLRIARRDGRYSLNPLAYRNSGRVRLLESMRKNGLLTKRVFKLDYVEYYVKEAA